jgi:hypothetical protein
LSLTPLVAASRIASYDAVIAVAAAYAVNHRSNVSGRRTIRPDSSTSRSTICRM